MHGCTDAGVCFERACPMLPLNRHENNSLSLTMHKFSRLAIARCLRRSSCALIIRCDFERPRRQREVVKPAALCVRWWRVSGDDASRFGRFSGAGGRRRVLLLCGILRRGTGYSRPCGGERHYFRSHGESKPSSQIGRCKVSSRSGNVGNQVLQAVS